MRNIAILALSLTFMPMTFVNAAPNCPKNKKEFSCEGIPGKTKDFICAKKKPGPKRMALKCQAKMAKAKVMKKEKAMVKKPVPAPQPEAEPMDQMEQEQGE